MLYVFLVDTGAMLTFKMELAMERLGPNLAPVILLIKLKVYVFSLNY